MKKLMTALAVCAVAGFALAQTVTSANVVGYNNVTLQQGFNMLCVNLDNVSAPAAGLDLNTLIPGTTANLTKGSAATADQVLVYDPVSGYSTYFLFFTTKTTGTTYNNQWVVNGSVPATNTFKSGDAFWYNKKGATPVTIPFAGQVPNDATKTRRILTGFNMIGSAYAADWDPNALGSSYWATNGAVHGAAGTADQILLYDPIAGYTTYFLFFTTKTTGTTYNNQWVLNGSTPAPANFVKMGSGVWYNHKGSGFALPQNVPYSL